MTRTSLVPALALSICLGACTGSTVNRSGGSVDSITLRATWGNGAAGVGSDLLDQLVRTTAGDPVKVGAPPPMTADTEDNEGDALRRLAAGDADLSVIRTDSLETAGAHSLAAFTAPFVISNEAQAAKVAADPMTADLLTGLTEIGLVGLGIAPGGLRHPVGYAEALVHPTDVSGKAINTRPGVGVERIISALGGRADHSVSKERSRRVSAAELRGIELSYLQRGAADKPAVFTPNVTLYTKFDVVVIRKRVYDTLSAPQQAALRAATKKSIDQTLLTRLSEDAAAKAWCTESDASAATVTPAVVAEWRAALQPVVDRLKSDPATAAAIARFARLHDGTTDPAGETCAGPSSQAVPATYLLEPVGAQTVMDGTWRTGATAEELRAAGVPYGRASVNAGVWTVHVQDGKGEWVHGGNGDSCKGNFTFAGDKVTLDFNLGVNNCDGLAIGTYKRVGDTVTFRWTAELNGELLLDNALLSRFVRIG